MTSSFRNEQKYSQLIIGFGSGVWYEIETGKTVADPKLDVLVFRTFAIDGIETTSVNLSFAPYVLGCSFA